MNVALTIAGSDSGGGAGIQADLKTFASLGVHGTCAITCLTAQNPKTVLQVQAATPSMVRAQIEAVYSELPPKAIKTGMLFSPATVQEVVQVLGRLPKVPIIVDPVMIATSGANLSKASAIKIMTRQLLPLAALVTPNLPEAEVLLGQKIRSVDDLRGAAKAIYAQYGCPALVKGGHFKGAREAVDFLFDGKEEWMLSAPFITGVHTHGTGCTYSAAVTAYIALGHSLPDAVRLAKIYITEAIAQHIKVSKHTALNHFPKIA